MHSNNLLINFGVTGKRLLSVLLYDVGKLRSDFMFDLI